MKQSKQVKHQKSKVVVTREQTETRSKPKASRTMVTKTSRRKTAKKVRTW